MMGLFKSYFSSQIYSSPRDLVDSYLKKIRMNSPGDLPPEYDAEMKDSMVKAEFSSEFLKQMVAKLPQQKVHGHLLKLLTLIHSFVTEKGYIRQEIFYLEDLDFHFLLKQEQEKWFSDFCLAYISYLIKLPSLSDIYAFLNIKFPDINPEFHLTYLFRLTNHIRPLLSPLLNAINIVGRYNAIAYSQMKELYRILSQQIVAIYNLIKFLTDQIMRQYRIYNPTDLKCFLRSLPELELTCDKVEDVVVNKYLKGKKNSCKVEFLQEKVAELQYYLQYENKVGEESLNISTNPSARMIIGSTK